MVSVLGINARILHDPKPRGLARHTLNLIRGLSGIELSPRIRLYSDVPIADAHKPALAGVEYRETSLRPHLLWEQAALPLQLFREKVDVFHSPLNLGVPFALPRGVGTVLTVHDLFTFEDLEKAPLRGNLADWRAYANFQVSWETALRADRIITVSEYSKAQIVSRFPSLEPRLRVVLNALAPEFAPGPFAFDPALEWMRDKRYIAYVGGYEERKNVIGLVKAYLELERAAPHPEKLPLLALGGGDLARHPELASHCARSTRIRELGGLTDAQVVNVYRGALFSVVPSHREGFGFAVVEGMACGTPMIVARTTSLPEIAGCAALLFDSRDTAELARLMAELIEREDLRKSLSESGLVRARDFSLGTMASGTLSVYREAAVAARRRRNPHEKEST